jgi:hypothetical protein
MSLIKEKIELEIEEAEFLAGKTLSQFPPIVKYALIICVLGIIPAYYISKNLSHKYWQKQYQSLLTSPRPSFSDALAPKISPITLIYSQNSYSALVKISNENLNLSLPETPYQVDFYNQKNETVYSSQGKIFLLPNQSKYVLVAKFNTNESIASANFYLTAPAKWQKRLAIAKVNLNAFVTQFSNQQDPLAFFAEGSLQNLSPYKINSVRLTFLVKNSSDEVLTASQRDEFNLEPGKTRSFKQLWPGVFLNNAAKVEIFADTNPLDRNNLNIQQESSTSSSDLSRPDTNNY